MSEWAEALATADEVGRETLEERAGIREFDGGMPRPKAEAAAALDWRSIVDQRVAAAKREIHGMASSARRSIGQQVRRAQERRYDRRDDA